MANRLSRETSPYLLQHKDNPVDWRPWGAEALTEARAHDKPILLSVGYAACHWCHVMAHESFEDADTARLMNDLFVNIKVDREERPDVDQLYQTALAMLGEQGGWPLTMFLTPAGEPFWGGTYFPPQPRYGRPAFTEALRAVAEAWHTQPAKVRRNVEALGEALRRHNAPTGTAALNPALLDQAAQRLLQMIDPGQGGLRGAPKFPQPLLFDLLWRGFKRSGDERLRDAVVLTLDRMSHGGIYDHLGGGYARYSTDELWLVPHFEKMLYDNALLVDLLTLAWQDVRFDLYKDRVAETIGWVLREMLAEGGAFAASFDADSEGEEGKFYVWDIGEIERLLPENHAATFKDAYDVPPSGNWEGHIILNRNKPQPAGGPEFERILGECRRILFEARSHRVPPGRDDKVLADWNGLMIAAMANAGFVFDRPDWLTAARTAFDAVRHQLGQGDRLGHTYRHGRVTAAGLLDDYAGMSHAALVLYEVTAEPAYLAQASNWVAAADRHFWDAEAGGYFLTADDAGDLLLRPKTAFDTAVPAGNGLMAQVLAKLFHLTGHSAYRDRADRLLAVFSGQLAQHFPNMAALLASFEMLDGATAVVIVGDPTTPDALALRRAVADAGLPSRALLSLAPGQALPPEHPAHGKDAVDSRATAYVCRGTTCSAPATSPEALRERLATR